MTVFGRIVAGIIVVLLAFIVITMVAMIVWMCISLWILMFDAI